MDLHTGLAYSTEFDFENLKTGDQFLGCPECWFRFNVGIAAKPVCPFCGSDRMRVYTVVEADLSPGSPDAAPR
jgi:hypothetical protein